MKILRHRNKHTTEKFEQRAIPREIELNIDVRSIIPVWSLDTDVSSTVGFTAHSRPKVPEMGMKCQRPPLTTLGGPTSATA